jgi:hypothetical protein
VRLLTLPTVLVTAQDILSFLMFALLRTPAPFVTLSTFVQVRTSLVPKLISTVVVTPASGATQSIFATPVV